MGRLTVRKRRIICIIVCSFALFGWSTAWGNDLREELVLSELLAQAERCGPAFMRMQELIALADLAEQEAQATFRLAGALEVGVGSDDFPSGFRQASISARWPITDRLTVAAEKNLFGTDGYVSVAWNQVLWPASTPAADTDHIDELELLRARFEAERGVLVAFQQAKYAETQWIFARENAHIARERFEIASLRFAAGEMGLSEWRSEEERLMQAEELVRVAERQRDEAFWNLSEVLFGGCVDAEAIWTAAEHTYRDDLDWDAVATAIMKRLQLSGHREHAAGEAIFADILALLAGADEELGMRALLERYDPAAQQARLRLRQKEQAVVEAARQKLPRISGVANVTQPLASASALEWHAGIRVTIDWSGSAQTEIERAQIELESAERELQATLRQVYRDGVQALERVREAQANVMARQQAAERAEEAARIVRLRVEAGFLTELDLAEAELAVANAMAQQERAIDDLKLAWFDLALRFGILPTDWLWPQR